jgi:c-di-GMP-binding flagellar brake protein YcgR
MDSFGTLGIDFFQKLVLYLIGAFAVAYMLYRLINYLRRPRRLSRAEKIDNPSDIKQLLKDAKKQRVRFRVRMNERKRSFNSSLVRLSGGWLLIDSLFPEEGNTLIADAALITIDFNLKEDDRNLLVIPYTFTATFAGNETVDGLPALRITLPNIIWRVQRRNYLRISPPVNQPAYISFSLDETPVREKIANISGGGVGFYTTYSKSVLWIGRRLKNVVISIPGRDNIPCSITVHSLMQTEQTVLIDRKPYHFFCGAEFSDIDEKLREKIVQYVIEKEREALRRLSRGYT